MQVAALVASGIALWYLTALMLRFLVPQGAFEGYWALLSYALVVPGTVPFVHALRRIGGLPHDRVAYGITVATASALLMDGVAVRWFPGIYGETAADVATAAGAVMWGAGVALVLGLAMNRRGSTDS
jgi:hypothetical protein